MAVLELPPLLLAYGAAAIFAAAFVRGFSGFGSSMIWISSLTLILPPREVVPMVLLFEVAASLALLPGVWREIHWRSLRWILAGTALATPFGVYLLVVLAADAVRIGIAVVVLAAVALIWRGSRFDLRRSRLSCGRPVKTDSGRNANRKLRDNPNEANP